MASRTLAGLSFVAGMSCLISALELSVLATECVEVRYQWQECQEAYTDPPQANENACVVVGDACTAATSSNCHDRWGIYFSGDCKAHELTTSNPTTCYEDRFSTLISVSWYIGACVGDAEHCECVFVETEDTQEVAICECIHFNGILW